MIAVEKFLGWTLVLFADVTRQSHNIRDVLRQGPVMQAAPGRSMPALQAAALCPPDLSWALVLRWY